MENCKRKRTDDPWTIVRLWTFSLQPLLTPSANPSSCFLQPFVLFSFLCNPLFFTAGHPLRLTCITAPPICLIASSCSLVWCAQQPCFSSVVLFFEIEKYMYMIAHATQRCRFCLNCPVSRRNQLSNWRLPYLSYALRGEYFQAQKIAHIYNTSIILPFGILITEIHINNAPITLSFGIH